MKPLRRFLTCLASAVAVSVISPHPADAGAFGFEAFAVAPFVTVNSVDYSNSFVNTGGDPEHQFVSGTVSTPDFELSLNVTALLDPVISYDLAFIGGGTVSILLVGEYIGGPNTFNTLTSQITGSLSDLNGDGSVSVTGSPWIQTGVLNGVVATQQFSTCSGSGGSGFQLQCPSSLVSGLGLPWSDSDLPVGFFSLGISFTLSPGDAVLLSGSSELVEPAPPTPVPEPGSLGMMVAGLVGSGLSARRRLRSPARP